MQTTDQTNNPSHMRVSLRRLEMALMRVLNVAEKNDAAKNIAAQLSNGSARMVGWVFLHSSNSNIKKSFLIIFVI